MKRLALALSLLLALAVSGAVYAALDGADWWTVDGGGGRSTGGDYALEATLGQPDTGSSAGGQYRADWGFWGSYASTIYHPLFPTGLLLEQRITYGDAARLFAFIALGLALLARYYSRQRQRA